MSLNKPKLDAISGKYMFRPSVAAAPVNPLQPRRAEFERISKLGIKGVKEQVDTAKKKTNVSNETENKSN